MVLHFNRSRLYKGTVGVSHGILVELLRHTKHFWKAYRDLLQINNKIESDEEDLQKVLTKLGLEPKKEKFSDKMKARILARLHKEFDLALEDLKNMFENLDEIAVKDETLLYRTMMDLVELYDRVWNIRHLPEHRHHEILHHLYSLMEHISHLQHHTWVVSKAHARGRTKVREMTFVSSRKEKRRLRKQTLELNHLLNRIEPLQEWIVQLKEMKSQKDIDKLQQRIVELLQLYHTEVSDIHHILQEAHVFTRRTEKLFHQIQHEAHSLQDKNLKDKVAEYAGIFRKIHEKFEDQARREASDIRIQLKQLPVPPKAAARAT